MENSFKKNYEKTVNPDGSFDLRFKSRRNNTGNAWLYISWFIPGCWIASKMLDWLPLKSVDGGMIVFFAAILFAAVLVVPPMLLSTLMGREDVITVIPNQGIRFQGRSLPFADVQSIGTESIGSSKNNAHIYAVSRGTKIKFTGYIPLYLAEALATEVKNSSGYTWT